ncbi:PqqD family protein [Gordonia sp. PDNC005]|nr:PqqD family protein [Gordonia sp. PDNC005]
MVTKYRLRNDVQEWNGEGDSVILFSPSSSKYFGTNKAGICLARRMSDWCRVEDLADVLEAEYGVEYSTAISDSSSFLKLILAAGIAQKRNWIWR